MTVVARGPLDATQAVERLRGRVLCPVLQMLILVPHAIQQLFRPQAATGRHQGITATATHRFSCSHQRSGFEIDAMVADCSQLGSRKPLKDITFLEPEPIANCGEEREADRSQRPHMLELHLVYQFHEGRQLQADQRRQFLELHFASPNEVRHGDRG